MLRFHRSFVLAAPLVTAFACAQQVGPQPGDASSPTADTSSPIHPTPAPPDVSVADASEPADAAPASDALVCIVSAPSDQFPTFARTCTSDTDCAYVLHQDCCGGMLAVGVTRACDALFVQTEQQWEAAHPPACGCAASNHAEDGQAFVPENPPVAVCTAGMCTTIVPPIPSRPDAFMSWQAPGGFAGTGPAVTVTGDGTVSVWRSMSGFSPDAQPSTPPDRTFRVEQSSVDDLFQRWATGQFASLPHTTTGGGECYPVAYARLCASCAPTTLQYFDPAGLLPEMDSVWSWFDAYAGGDNALAPRTYCAF